MKLKSKINLLYWYIFLITFLEIIYKLFVWNKLFDIKLLTILFFSIPFSFVLYFVSSLWKPTINKIISISLSFLLSLLFVAQFIYYQFYKSIFSIYSIKMGTAQVFGEFGDAILDYIIRFWYVTIIMLLPVIIYSLYLNKFIEYKKSEKKTNILFLIIFISLYSLNFISLLFMKDGLYSNYNLYYNIHSPMITINRLGVLSMEKLDVKRYLFGLKEDIGTFLTQEKVEYKEELNMINIDFDSLIKKEKDKQIKEMHKYFSVIDASNKNEYTGILKDKNLIFITAESLDISAIKEDITPTLYKMMNNSFIFKNYYQPLYPVSTSDGEYMAVTSLLPKEGVWSFYESSKIKMPYALGNVFNDNGYKSYGYHNHTYTYYHRDLSHPNIGLDYLACGNGLEKRINCKIWPESDLEMIKATTEDYINSDKFLAYYMTISGHLRYNYYNSIVVKNLNEIKNLNFSNAVKSYFAANIELDKALDRLLTRLEAKGKLNDTLIVITPDHYPYGLSVEQLNEISDKDRSDKFELYHTSLIMYNPQIENKIVEDYISSIDIIPTIYNLFGLTYDSRLLIGRDIFSDNEKIVIFSDRSWITNKGKYDSITKTFEPFVGNVDDDYINYINKKVNQKFLISSLILEKDYYKYLEGEL